MNAQRMVEAAGVERCGFLTLTVGDYQCSTHGKQNPTAKDRCPQCRKKMPFVQVYDAAEASKRINSVFTHLLGTVFSQCILVSERHKSGAIHFHAVGVLTGLPDIRTGYSFREVRHNDYSSVSPELKAIWKTLREKLPRFGFGRAELTPIRKTGGAVASYVSKYIEKNIRHRHAQDKGKKLVRYHGFNRQHLKPNEFEWNSDHAVQWRARTRQALALVEVPLNDAVVTPSPTVAQCVLLAEGCIRAKCLDGTQAREVLGSRWAFKVTRLLAALQLAEGPKLTASWLVMDLLSRELQKLAGRRWCKSAELPVCEVLLGEEYTRRQWREMWKGLPMPPSAKKPVSGYGVAFRASGVEEAEH
jgi:hypothetical protein